MNEIPLKQRLALLAAISLFIASWTLPSHSHPWTTAHQEFAAFSACLAIVLATTLRADLRISTTIIPFFLIPAIPLLQFSSGLIIFFGDALIATTYLAGFSLMILSGYNLSRSSAMRRHLSCLLAISFIVSSLASSLIAVRQWLLISNSIWEVDIAFGARPYANMGQANLLATLFSLGLAGTLYLFITNKLNRFSASAICITLLFSLALTQSRTPWAASIAVIFFSYFKSNKNIFRGRTRLILCWALVYYLLVLVLPYISDCLLLTSADPLARAKSLERLDLWKQFWDSAMQAPVWGYGWNQAISAQIKTSLLHPVAIVSEHSHNIVLDLLLWNGIFLGALIVLTATIWLAWLGWRSSTNEAFFSLVASGIVITHGMLEYPLEYAFYLLPTGLLLGMAAADKQPDDEIKTPKWIVTASLLTGALLLFLFWKDYRAIEEDHLLLRFEIARIGTLKAAQPAPNTLLTSQLREQIRFFRTPITDSLDDRSLETLRKVAYRYPSPAALYRYTLALSLNYKIEESRTQLTLIRNLHGETQYMSALDLIKLKSTQHPQLLTLLQTNLSEN